MIPHLLRLLFEKVNIFPSEEIIKIVEKESTFAIPKFLDVLVHLAYDPCGENDAIHNEAKQLIETIVESSISFEMLRYLFELQGPFKDKQINNTQGNTLLKALPDWKQKAFDLLIRRISCKDGGIRHLMLTLSDMMGSDRSPKVACDVAKCICRSLIDANDLENNFKLLSIQIIDLLQISSTEKIKSLDKTDKKEHSIYLKFSRCVAVECVNLCSRINKNYAQKYLLDVLFSDFYRITNSELIIDEFNFTIVPSEQLIESLNLHYSLLTTFAPSHYIQSLIRSFSSIYLLIMTLKVDKNTPFTTIAKDIIVRSIELIHGTKADPLSYIKCLVGLEVPDNYLLLNGRLTIRHCLDRENIEVAWNDAVLEDVVATWDPSEDLNNCFMTVLPSLPESLKEDLINKLFLWLLECHFSVNTRNEIVVGIENEYLKSKTIQCKERLLESLCSEMESYCFNQTTDILKIAKIVISRYCLNRTRDGHDTICQEHLDFALSIVVCALESGKLKDEDKVIFNEMFPLLADIRDTHTHAKTRDLATDISIIIATRGHVNFLSKAPIMIDKDVNVSISEELKDAFSDIDSDEIPIKGHGLLVLYKLLKAKNESALQNRNKIYGILSQLLFHPESFIYLRAISGLSVMGAQYTKKMLPMIAQRVRACRGNHSLLPGVNDSSTLEDWLKLSEVFMKIINGLGDTAPMYLDIILSSLMTGLADREEMVRASSLSNLSELCCQHDYILSPVIYEVVTAVCNVLVTDQSIPVKNAASLFIRRLLNGKDDYPRADLLQRFPTEVLMTIKRSLETVLNTDTNEMVLDHASAAWNSLDQSVRLLIRGPEPNLLEKRIKILDLSD